MLQRKKFLIKYFWCFPIYYSLISLGFFFQFVIKFEYLLRLNIWYLLKVINKNNYGRSKKSSDDMIFWKYVYFSLFIKVILSREAYETSRMDFKYRNMIFLFSFGRVSLLSLFRRLDKGYKACALMLLHYLKIYKIALN